MKWFVIERFSIHSWYVYAVFAVHIDGQDYLERLKTLDSEGRYKSTLRDSVTL